MAFKVYDIDALMLGFEEPIYERDVNSITEQAGYVDAGTQVNRLLKAGATLMDIRRATAAKPGEYEYEADKVPSDPIADPTMSVGFDVVDGDQLLLDFEAKKKAYLAAAEALQKQQAAQKEGLETSSESGVQET